MLVRVAESQERVIYSHSSSGDCAPVKSPCFGARPGSGGGRRPCKGGARLNDYELMFILAPDLEEEVVTTTTDRVRTYVTSRGGEVRSLEPWGRRRLAYPIQRFHEGNYHIAHRSRTEWFNTSAFAIAQPWSLGNAPRYFSDLRAPSYKNFDISIQKKNVKNKLIL